MPRPGPGVQPRRAHPLHGWRGPHGDDLGRGRRPPARATIPHQHRDHPRQASPPAFAAQPRRAHPRGREARRPGGPDRRRDAAQDGRLRGLPRQVGARDRVLARRAPAGGGRGGGGVGLWDAGSGKRVGPLLSTPRGPRGPRSVQALAFGPGGLLAAAGTGGARTSGARRRADLGPRRAEADPAAAAPAAPRARAGLRPRRLATRDRDRLAGVEVRDLPGGERLAIAADRRARRSPATRSRSPSRPTAGCSRVASATATSSSGRRTAGGRWGSWLPRAGALGLAFSPDGRTLATSTTTARSCSGTSAPSSRSARRFRCRAAGDSDVTARFTPDGDRLFAVSDAGTRDPLGGRSRGLGATRVRRRRRRPHARAVGRGRPRAGLRVGLPLGLRDSTAARCVDRESTGRIPLMEASTRNDRALHPASDTNPRHPHAEPRRSALGRHGEHRQRREGPGPVVLLTTGDAAHHHRAGPAGLPWACQPPRGPPESFYFGDRQVGTTSPVQRFGLGAWCQDAYACYENFTPSIEVSGDFAQTNNCAPTLAAAVPADRAPGLPDQCHLHPHGHRARGGHPEHRPRGADADPHRQRGHHPDSAGPAPAALRPGRAACRLTPGASEKKLEFLGITNNTSTVVARGDVRRTMARLVAGVPHPTKIKGRLAHPKRLKESTKRRLKVEIKFAATDEFGQRATDELEVTLCREQGSHCRSG